MNYSHDFHKGSKRKRSDQADGIRGFGPKIRGRMWTQAPRDRHRGKILVI